MFWGRVMGLQRHHYSTSRQGVKMEMEWGPMFLLHQHFGTWVFGRLETPNPKPERKP